MKSTNGRITISSVLLLLMGAGIIQAQNSAPEWTRGAVWYQIVPERFRNFNPYNDPVKAQVVGKEIKDWQVHPWASDFYKPQIWEEERGIDFDKLVIQRRYGGDLIGVIEKLNYLKSLGVNVIYLTPVFESPSVLKYDFSTLHHVDDNFGTKRKEDAEKIAAEREDPSTWTLTSSDEVFLELIERAHKSDIKVVIEAQFAYCSTEFWAFKDVAQKQQDSAYKDWFQVSSWDDPATPDTVEFVYKTWEGNKKWPLLKQDDSGPAEPIKKYIFEMTRRWMRPTREHKPVDGIDGWFVDIGLEALPAGFWSDWIQLVKSLNAEAVTVAARPMKHQGTNGYAGFDLLINSEVADVINKSFIAPNEKTTVSDLDQQLQQLQKDNSEVENYSFIGRLGDQTMMRLASRIKNPQLAFNGADHSGNMHEFDPTGPSKDQIQTQKLIAFFQLTYPGSPMIYYGDESGMWGGSSPYNLKPMLWREFLYEDEIYKTIRPDLTAKSRYEFNKDLWEAYSNLGQIRNENPALRRGDFRPIVVDDAKKIYAYARTFDKNEVLVFVNSRDEDQSLTYLSPWEKGTKVKDLLKNEKFKLKTSEIELRLPKRWGVILARD